MYNYIHIVKGVHTMPKGKPMGYGKPTKKIKTGK